MTFPEILKHFLAGEKIRRESWDSKDAWMGFTNSHVISNTGKSAFIGCDIEATDWQLYKEPAPEPVEKTLGQILDGIWLKLSQYSNGHCEPEDYPLEELASEFEAEVLRRFRESLPKVEGKTAGQVLCESHGCNWSNLYETTKDAYESQAVRFITAYQLAQPEPKTESAIERLFNSGFGKTEIFHNYGSYVCQFLTWNKHFKGYGDTPELAAQNAIDQFKKFIAGL